MVLQKRLDYGFNGYQVPPTPRATRSSRRRGSVRKKADINQMCAFDLLATVAGKLLLDGRTPGSSDIVIGREQSTVVKDYVGEGNQDESELLKEKPSVEGTYAKNFFASELVLNAPFVNDSTKEISHVVNDTYSDLASVITNSGCSEKDGFSEKLVHSNHKIEPGMDVYSSGCRLSSCFGSENDSKKDVKVELASTGNVLMSAAADKCSLQGPVVWESKTSALVTSDNGVKLPFCADNIPCGSFPSSRDDVKLAIRDDDENSSGCTCPRTMNKALRPPPRIGDRRIRKLLASKYWKVTPRMKNEEHLHSDAGVKALYNNSKNCYKRQRSQRDYPFKKRKLYYRSSASNSDGGMSSDGTSSLPGKDSGGHDFSLGGTVHEAIGTSNAAPSQHASFQPTDSHVKLKIKSFRVPELFIEIPETATVGSLKRTVMEAVTAILSGGLHVGVLLQGKKIRDDNKTLLQTGIAHDNKLDALGFTLEPNLSQASLPPCLEDHPFLLPFDTQQPLTRYPLAPEAIQTVGQQGSSDGSPGPPMPNLCDLIESDHDSAPSPPDMSMDKNATDSRAIVAVPAVNVGALAVVPMRKSKRSEAVQRRIRRPFSVSEVEALVQAVEKLGTGRWRDVKLRAFDNAKHRTYVDLKDKWKTLVHTARISPQQRRGEPVPQELLDRVLTANAYWSQQQAKQQLKQQQPDTCLLL